MTGRVGAAAALLLLAVAGCEQDDEVVYTQFNAADDALTIQVGASELLAPVEVELHSTTGSVVVGSAIVDPGGGPVGTTHQLTVEVVDEYEDQVVRATVRTASPERGEDEYELEGDSADEGLWQIELVSAGAADEIREDTFTVRLWELEGVTIEPGEEGEDTGR